MEGATIADELGSIDSMRQALKWAAARLPPATFVRAVQQDEFTFDVVVGVGSDTYVVFDTT
jgi:hypothetical protein